MRNKHQANHVTLGVLVVLLFAVGGVSRAFDQAQPPPAQAQTPPPQPPPADPQREAEDAKLEQQGDEKSTERFLPSQKTSADNSASFPVDI